MKGTMRIVRNPLSAVTVGTSVTCRMERHDIIVVVDSLMMHSLSSILWKGIHVRCIAAQLRSRTDEL